MALPIDMSTVSAADKYPEGRFRVRVLSAEVRPKDAEINDQCEVVGQVTEKGTQKYCGLSVGFRYIEHPSNYTVDENGKDLSMGSDAVSVLLDASKDDQACEEDVCCCGY